MALTKCPECGKALSSHAATCPHCGFPFSNDKLSVPEELTQLQAPQQKSRRGIFSQHKRWWFVLIIIALIVSAATSWQDSNGDFIVEYLPSLLGYVLAIFSVASILSGFVALVYWIARKTLTPTEFMYTFTVALFIVIISIIYTSL